MANKVKVLGIKETIASMEKYSKDQQDKFKELVSKTAFEVKRGAKSRVPVNSGRTKKDIVIKTPKGSKGLSKSVIAKNRGSKKSKDFFNPMWLEFGTVKTPSRKFMIPAEEQAKGNFEKTSESIVKEKVVI